jgi:hypothetical protein
MSSSLESALSFSNYYGGMGCEVYLTLWRPKEGEVTPAPGKVGIYDQNLEVPPELRRDFTESVEAADLDAREKQRLGAFAKIARFYLPGTRLVAIATLNPNNREALKQFVGRSDDEGPEYFRRYAVEKDSIIGGVQNVLEASSIRQFNYTLSPQEIADLMIRTELNLRMEKITARLVRARRWGSYDRRSMPAWSECLSTLQEVPFDEPYTEAQRITLSKQIADYLEQLRG